MQSSSIREASQTCFHGFCPTPLLGLPEHQTSSSITTAASCHYDFEVAMACSIYPNSQFTNHESLPSLHESFSNFTKAVPQYLETTQADQIREQEYYNLSSSNHVCLDYVGHGLFSYHQQQSNCQGASLPSTSSSPPPVYSTMLEQPFFGISFKPVNLFSHVQYGGQESDLEDKMRKRIMAFMNISENDYSLVFTANQSSAFKLLAESYPFQSNKRLLTVYDHESEPVKMMIESSKNKGVRTMSAEFSWPTLSIKSGKLLKKVESRRKKRGGGLFAFPLYSRMTGARYSYFWMTKARENGWHVLLDACALGPKEMETLGLSIFKPDFLICSFFKVFGENPSGFGCLFVKKSSASILKDATTNTSVGIVRPSPAIRSPSKDSEELTIAAIATEEDKNIELQNDSNLQGSFEMHEAAEISGTRQAPEKELDEHSELHQTKDIFGKQKAEEIEQLDTTIDCNQSKIVKDGVTRQPLHQTKDIFGKQKAEEIEQLDTTIDCNQSKIVKDGVTRQPELECRGLDQADSLGLILISARARCLINWLVNALMSLQHPHPENGLPLVRIYGPKIRFDRGPVIAFNVVDWKGEKIDPLVVQKLADRNNISLSCGFLQQNGFSGNYQQEKEKLSETRIREGEDMALNVKREKHQSGISVVTAALGFLTNFEDTYRLWAFVSRFLDADFVEKERWRYTALNQKIIEV